MSAHIYVCPYMCAHIWWFICVSIYVCTHMVVHICAHIYECSYMNVQKPCTTSGFPHHVLLAPGCQNAEVRNTVTPCFQTRKNGYKTQKQLTSVHTCVHIWTFIYGHRYMNGHICVRIYEPDAPIYEWSYMCTHIRTRCIHIWVSIYGYTYMIDHI